MGQTRYNDEFKKEAIRNIMEEKHPVTKVAERVGVSCHSLYHWMNRLAPGKSASSMRIAGRDTLIRFLLSFNDKLATS